MLTPITAQAFREPANSWRQRSKQPKAEPDMSTASRGAHFEERVFGLLETEIRSGRFFIKPECFDIFRRRPYYSRDRGGNIIFDVAVEVRLPFATAPSLLILIECKDCGRPVPVDDVEEFFVKVQQVAAANSKGILAATSSFQKSAVEFARAKGIGLLRVFPSAEFKWVLHRSPSSMKLSRFLSRDEEILLGLTDEQHQSRTFDCFCNANKLFTYSLHDFFMAFASETLSARDLNAFAPERTDDEVVAFVGPDDIERRCQEVHAAIGYKSGMVSLEAVCQWQQHETGLAVEQAVSPTREERHRGILGRISFSPPAIIVFRDLSEPDRQRFTLAHELGHYLLGHGLYLGAESVDVRDIETGHCIDIGDDDIRRLEWQANNFRVLSAAAARLIPRWRYREGSPVGPEGSWLWHSVFRSSAGKQGQLLRPNIRTHEYLWRIPDRREDPPQELRVTQRSRRCGKRPL